MKPGDLAHLTGVREAQVYKAGEFAATIRRVDAEIEFAYIPTYLAAAGPPVATTLPLSDVAVRTHGGAVAPFFAGLLPEGRRLSGLRRAVKTSADDELSLLLAVGSDVIGDVQIVVAGLEPARAAPVLQVTDAWSEVRFADVMADSGVVDPVGLPGVQDKVSARMISVPIDRAGERFLLKVDPPEFPHVVANERYFLGLARASQIPAADATVVHDADGRPGLLVRRFDRVAQPGGDTMALACEDGCQVLGRWPADKYNLTSEEVVAALSERCAARPVALRSLYQQLCYGWLTGNGDIHAKNLSILATVDGEWRVAPAYDLPSTVPYGDTSLALSMGDRTRGLGRRHLLDFARSVGLPDRAAERVLDGLLQRLVSLDEQIAAGALPFGERVTRALRKELGYRRRLAVGS